MSTADRVRVALLVDGGSRDGVSGGDRYDAALVAAAASHGCSMHTRRVGGLRGAVSLRTADPGADIMVIDSLVAWRAAVGVRRRGRPPAVALVHQRPGGTDGRRALRALRERLDVATYRSCDLVVTTGRAIADDLARRGVGRVEVVEPGCDLPPAAPAAPLRGARRIGLISVANWLPNKGIVDLLDAVERLPDDTVELHLVGRTDVDPAYATEVRSRIDRPSLRGRVTVHGAVGPARVASLVAAADVLVLPSRVESYGMVVAEALALGVPVVGWRAPHLEVLVTDGVDALLADPFDVDALARSIDRLAGDAELLARLTAGAHLRGDSLPRWSSTTTRFFELLTDLVPRPAHRGAWRRPRIEGVGV